MDIEEFRNVFRGSPIKRAKFSGVRRNVVTAMGNSGRLEFIPRLQELARDEDAAVAEHAQWALRQLELSSGQSLMENTAHEHRQDSK
jgi:epoxyqueuosine reductase